ncbi:EF-hand domain-containing protein [Streptomyces sp. NPDC049837]|uniref:EF-hand domain-containing protein n=1 Tax=Streptomyces sp. NPDC049837 TaxID=3155277 RepID=UPI003428C587
MSINDYRQKIASRFGTFDRDGDGVVTEADFRQLAQSILAEFGESPATPKGKALIQGAQHLWRSFADIADTDGDGRITEDEFVEAACDHLLDNRSGFTGMVRPWALAVIDVADTDGDGEVTVQEWERMLRAMRATPERARVKAVQLDIDGDGRVSVDEVLETAVRFYATDEPIADFAVAR